MLHADVHVLDILIIISALLCLSSVSSVDVLYFQISLVLASRKTKIFHV